MNLTSPAMRTSAVLLQPWLVDALSVECTFHRADAVCDAALHSCSMYSSSMSFTVSADTANSHSSRVTSTRTEKTTPNFQDIWGDPFSLLSHRYSIVFLARKGKALSLRIAVSRLHLDPKPRLGTEFVGNLHLSLIHI